MMGMMSQSTALNTIGNNIANVSTVGYKKTDNGFATILSRSIQNVSDLGGVKPQGMQRIDKGGNVVASNRNLDAAINGKGMFVLNTKLDGTGETFYTRDGTFSTVKGADITATADDGVSTITTQEAHLVDKNGYYVMAWQPQPDGSFNTAGAMSAMRVDAYAFQGNAITTSQARMDLNLPADGVVGDSNLYNIKVYDSTGVERAVTLDFVKQTALNAWTVTPKWTDTPTAQVDTAIYTGTAEAGDVYTLSAGGGSVSYTALGTDANLDAIRDKLIALANASPTMSSAVTASAGGTGAIVLTANTAGSAFTTLGSVTPGAIPDNGFVVTNTVANDTGVRSGTTTALTFDSNAALVSPLSIDVAANWGTATVATSLDISSATQYSGAFEPGNYWQNGFGTGQLREISFDAQGQVQGQFTNSLTRPLYRMGLAVFANPNGLEMVSGNLFRESELSGSANIVAPDENSYGTVSGNAREMSNVDVAEEFTNMIVTQQAYNSAATVFRTVDEMTTTARDLKR